MWSYWKNIYKTQPEKERKRRKENGSNTERKDNISHVPSHVWHLSFFFLLITSYGNIYLSLIVC